MVEFTAIFMVLFLFILLIIQTAFLLTARQMVHYAAFNAARSVIVHMNSEVEDDDYVAEAKDAAAISCIPISPSISFSGLSLNVDFPSSLGDTVSNLQVYLIKYVVARYLLTSIDVFDEDGNSLIYDDDGDAYTTPKTVKPGKDVTVQVTHDYVLRIPLINKLFFKMYWLNKAEEELGFSDLSFLSNYVDGILDSIDLPSYWIPISATSTLTVEGYGSSVSN